MIKELWKQFKARHFKQHKELKEGILGLVLISLIVLSTAFFYTGKHYGRLEAQSPPHKPISGLENYLNLYQSQYGKGGEEGENNFTIQVFGLRNIPSTLWDEDLTVNEAINIYYAFHFFSKPIMSSIIKDICTWEEE